MDISQIPYAEEAMMDDATPNAESTAPPRNSSASTQSPRPHKPRSLSVGDNAPRLFPSPHIVEASRRASKDDASLYNVTPAPVTPLSTTFVQRGPSLQMNTRGPGPINSPAIQSKGGHGSGSRTFFNTTITTNPTTASSTSSSSFSSTNTTTTSANTAAIPSGAGTIPPSSGSSTSKTVTTPTLTTSNGVFLKPTSTTPISPQVEHSQIYASPTSSLPRRSRGLDFSRAATSLHHSTLADQALPDSSPTTGSGRSAVNIPGRRPSDFAGPEHSSSSLWSVVGNSSGAPTAAGILGGVTGGSTKTNNHLTSNNPASTSINHHPHHNRSSSSHLDHSRPMSSSLGSALNMAGSDSSSSSGEDDYMYDEMDIVTTPKVNRTSGDATNGVQPWMPAPSSGSPGPSQLSNSPAFQKPQRRIKQAKKKFRGPLGLGLPPSAIALSKSPPANMMLKDLPNPRRESISWAANQLHISSGNESDENRPRTGADGDGVPYTPTRDGSQRGVIRRPVTRRQNLLPKTKGFARIKAELIEESAPVEADLRSESQVIRQVRESDMDLEPRLSATTTALSSPLLGAAEDVANMPIDDMMMMDAISTVSSSSFKQHAVKNSKGKAFWDTFSESSSIGGRGGTTPPPGPGQLGYQTARTRSRASTVAPGGDGDVNMDSPIVGPSGFVNGNSIGGVSQHVFGPSAAQQSSSDSQQQALQAQLQQQQQGGQSQGSQGSQPMTPLPPLPGCMTPPTAAEITRRINNKRRRDDDFDPMSFKRRAVSPGMSVHNSPVLQSPLQRDCAPWGSRPGSNAGERDKMSSAAGSETGSLAGGGGGNGGGPPGGGGNGGAAGQKGVVKGTVGLRGMVDTSDGLMRMSIE